MKGATDDKPLVEVIEASKAYPLRTWKDLLLLRRPRRVQALRNVSLELPPGHVTALLGPNGAGKTTLINIICGLTEADSGSVSVAGFAVPEDTLRAQRKIGYVTTNDRSFFWRLTGRQNLEFFGALHGLSRRVSKRRAEEMLARFGLAAAADRIFYTYSAGMKKRLGLGRAFMHDPEVILMDEPTNGLDAQATEDLLDLVRHEIRAAGKSVLWATHRAEEVERLCDRVVILGEGRVCFDGTLEDFRELSRSRGEFVIEASLPTAGRRATSPIAPSHGGDVVVSRSDGLVEVSGIRDVNRLSSILRELLEQGAIIKKVERQAEPLHEIFTQLKERA